MPIIPLDLGAQSSPHWYRLKGAGRLINAYAVKAPDGSPSPYQLRAVDGERVFSASSNIGPVRALYDLDGTLLAVIGRLFYTIDTSGVRTQVGGIASDGVITWARNRRSPNPQVAFASGGSLHVYSNGALTQVADADLLACNSVSILDGYLITTVADGRWQISGIDTATAWDGLDIATAESNPDGLVRGAVRGSELVLFGTSSLEVWRNSGGEFPFERVTTIRDLGCLSAATVANTEQSLVWVASDGTVRRLNGYQAEPISEDWLHELIAAERPDALEAVAWVSRGQWFYSLSGTRFTAQYNARTQRWHERRSYELPRWRMSAAAQFGGKIIAGDYADGTLYELTPDVHAEGSRELILEVITPLTQEHPRRIEVSELFVNAVPGTGLATGASQDVDPVISMSHSINGGMTWSSERPRALGRQGRYNTRTKWTRLGTSKEDGMAFRFRMSAAHVRGIDSAALDAVPLEP